jgi:hypothetical protein
MSSVALPATPLIYIECDIPAGMTVDAWRASRRTAGAEVSAMSGVLRRVRRARRARRRNGA